MAAIIPLGLKAVKAQQKADDVVALGASETHLALAKIYPLTQQLKQLEPAVLRLLWKDKWYDKPNPGKPGTTISAALNVGTPAFNNPAVAICKLAFPGTSPGFLSKCSTVIARAMELAISDDRFVAWLSGAHVDSKGRALGKGLTAAYKAHLSGKPRPKGKEEKEQPRSLEIDIAPSELETIRAQALKTARTVAAKDWPLQDTLGRRMHGMAVTLDYRDGDIVSFLSVTVTDAMLKQLLSMAAAQSAEELGGPNQLEMAGG
jgi:hypothetical protein